jgi:gallate dioxygenase
MIMSHHFSLTIILHLHWLLANQYSVANEDGFQRHVPPIPGHSELVIHIGKSLTSDEFDMSFFQNKTLNHGTFSQISMFANEDI